VAVSRSNAWRLRWRSPDSQVSPDDVPAGRPVAPRAASRAVLIWSGSEPARAAVRQAQWSASDPFDDPFGDQPASVPTGLGAPQLVAPGEAAAQPEPMPADPFSEPFQQAAPQTAPPADAAPLPPGETLPELPSTPPLPDTFGPSPESARPCDRTYNNRNCCTEGDNCDAARRHVLNDKITNILIDITPSFTNTDVQIPTDVMMRRELAKSPSRVWRDRAGRQLAEGRLLDYREGRILVGPEEGGETVKIPFKDLSDDDLCFVTAWWSLPTECPLGDEVYSPRSWLAVNMMWKASAVCHKPLYFEEVQLERYGHTTGPITQPFFSAAHFFGSLVALPYQMGIHPPHECLYPLGYYRPGSCAPWLVPPIPLSVRGALAEAGAIVGGVYIIP
jgi:hypothetical protein